MNIVEELEKNHGGQRVAGRIIVRGENGHNEVAATRVNGQYVLTDEWQVKLDKRAQIEEPKTPTTRRRRSKKAAIEETPDLSGLGLEDDNA